MDFMQSTRDIALEDWARPGEPFRLVAVALDAADWLSQLPLASQERVARFSDLAGKAQAGASEWLKVCWLPRETGLAAAEWTVGAHGKPRLAGAGAAWDFNLSHAGNYAVAALARGAQVGVDLESLARPADIELLGRRVFSEGERELVRAGGREMFFDLWSRKEALLKALGCGWADGGIVRRTQIGLAAVQTEPATGVRIWSRRVLGGSYALAVALN